MHPTAVAAAPATPSPITRTEARLPVLVTQPVLQDFNHSQVVVDGSSAQLHRPPAPLGETYWIQVTSPAQVVLGTYRVHARTARICDAATGQEFDNPELEAAQRIVRGAHGISVMTRARLER